VRIAAMIDSAIKNCVSTLSHITVAHPLAIRSMNLIFSLTMPLVVSSNAIKVTLYNFPLLMRSVRLCRILQLIFLVLPVIFREILSLFLNFIVKFRQILAAIIEFSLVVVATRKVRLFRQSYVLLISRDARLDDLRVLKCDMHLRLFRIVSGSEFIQVVLEKATGAQIAFALNDEDPGAFNA
jgi:hypothetical protein